MTKYQQREYGRAMGKLNALSFNHLGDRQAARDEYREALKTPELVAQRAEWLLDGHYGEGAALIGRAIVEGSSRNNKVAQLSQVIAGFEWQCPALFARKAYLSLDKEEQEAINSALSAVIDEDDED